MPKANSKASWTTFSFVCESAGGTLTSELYYESPVDSIEATFDAIKKAELTCGLFDKPFDIENLTILLHAHP